MSYKKNKYRIYIENIRYFWYFWKYHDIFQSCLRWPDGVEVEFQMIRANTIRTIVRIICRIPRMISCVARIIMSQSDYC